MLGDNTMVEFQIRNRHRLRKKVVRELVHKLNNLFSTTLFLENLPIDSAMVEKYEVIIIDNELSGFMIDGEPFFTIRGILRFKPEKRFVTVDMGAVKFVSNGADVMSPGIIDADENIQVGDIVWVRDEKNLQPLAIGKGLMTGPLMVENTSEKAVKSLHYIGDTLWKIKLN